MRTRRAWGAFTADLAANLLTYLGVLLALVVVYVFYAFGYIGEVIDEQHKGYRPLVEVGTVLFFLGLAWVLRHRTGIPQTAIAIEVIGLILIPVMLSALFRDGCTPAYHPWCVPPDLEGPARWGGYAGAAVVSGVIYYLFARRRPLYAWLVPVAAWVAVGAAALYLEDGLPLLRSRERLSLDVFTRDGISSAQLIAVLAAIALGVIIAGRTRHRASGTRLAVPTVRAAVVAIPVVLGLSIVFAWNDALARGIATPGLDELAWPASAAMVAAAAGLGAASRARYAWVGLGRRVAREMERGLIVAAYSAVGIAILVSPGFGVSPAWLGVGLMAYALIVVLVDQWLGGASTVPRWIAAGAGAVGAVLAVLEPVPASVAWGSLLALAVARSSIPGFRSATNALARIEDEGTIVRRAQLWFPAFVALLAGPCRMAWPDATPWVLIAAAGAGAAARFLPRRLAELRSFAAAPAIVAGAAALGLEGLAQISGTGMSLLAVGGLLLAGAAVAFAVVGPWAVRLPVGTALLAGGSTLIVGELLEADALGAASINTITLAVLGLALVVGSLVQPRPTTVVINGATGHAALLAALTAGIGFEVTALIGLTALATGHAAEAVAVETGRPCVTVRIAEALPRYDTHVRSLPSVVASVLLVPIAILAGRQVPWLRDERARFGPVLAFVSWLYAAVAGTRLQIRGLARVFAVALAGAAVAVAVPSQPALVITTWSATAATAVLATRPPRPYRSLPSWGFGVAAAMLSAQSLGIESGDLGFVLHGLAVAMLVFAATVNIRLGRHAGLTSTWTHPPAIVGLLLVPAGIALAMGRGSGIAAVALTAAAAYGYFGWATRTGGLSIPVAGALAIGYGQVLYDAEWAHPFDQPLAWMPLAAALIAASGLLPSRRSVRVLEDPAPGLLIAGLGLATLATVVGAATGVPDRALSLAIDAVLLVGIAVIRRHEAWLIAAGACAISAGLIAGDGWAPGAVLATTAAAAALADRHRDESVGAVLRWSTPLGLVATFALTAEWLEWTPGEAVAAAAVAAAVLLPAATALALVESWPSRIRLWAGPGLALGHAALATAVIIAAVEFRHVDAFGVAAGVAGVEAVWLGIVGTVRRSEGGVVVSGALAAVAYGFAAAWLGWEASTLVAATSVVGGVLLGAWVAVAFRGGLPDRLVLWVPVVLGAAQLAWVGTLIVAWAGLEPGDAFGVAAGVAGVEAVWLGIVGTVRRSAATVAASAVAAVAAYGLGAAWLEWTAPTFVAVTSAAGASLLLICTVLSFRTLPTRLALWMPVGIVTAHGAAVVVVAAAWVSFTSQDASGVAAGVASAESVWFGTVGTLRRRPAWVGAALGLSAVAYGLAVAWQQWEPATVVAVSGSAAVVAMVTATLVTRTAEPGTRLGLWVVPLHCVALGLAAITGLTGWSEFSQAATVGIASLTCLGAGAHLALNAWAAPQSWPVRESSAVAWVASVGFLSARQAVAETATLATVLAVAAIALPAAFVAGRLATTASGWRRATAILAAGLGAVATVTGIAEYGVVSPEVAATLVLVGGSIATYGLVCRRMRFVEAAAIVWLLAALIAVETQLTLSLHLGIVLTSATLLPVIEMERHRLRAEHARIPPVLVHAEQVVIAAPLVFASYETLERLWFTLVLFAEGAAFAAWGIRTQVRRRVALGFLGMVAAIVLAAAVPIASGIRSGLTGGTWLVIGAIAAVAFIAVGSIIERRRVAIGERIRRVGEIMESWE